ncbi:hypothetical protein CC1G_15387 [Coprinopsis cinerea okayama7|uniref:Uncharacterized protein n=1 Tax=Coprinopsis cinerea (strain Okayama-7 / 130 / ATCC MYA-4618 / FGSC 9003) TaxID=240176 RepID=D6RQR7_COPC7|nr:hypothetical protein CC1G_15387 [Coprinopsis cinerea okayama7\|eukprot:XP_002910109.1 hypothetical protein CC1G_15387 [Coprinopsis cinerea okayama7\
MSSCSSHVRLGLQSADESIIRDIVLQAWFCEDETEITEKTRTEMQSSWENIRSRIVKKHLELVGLVLVVLLSPVMTVTSSPGTPGAHSVSQKGGNERAAASKDAGDIRRIGFGQCTEAQKLLKLLRHSMDGTSVGVLFARHESWQLRGKLSVWPELGKKSEFSTI